MTGLLSKIIQWNRICVIGITYSDSGISVRAMTVQRRNDKLHVVRTEAFPSLEELGQKLDKKIPVVLLIDGKGVLHKKIADDNFEDSDWFRSLDPAAVSFTNYRSETGTFIAFCKKSLADELSDWCKTQQIALLDLFIGTFFTALLFEDASEKTLVAGTLKMEIYEGNISGFLKTEESATYKMEGTDFDQETIALYAAAVQHFAGNPFVSGNWQGGDTSEELRYKKAFETLGTGMLVFFLVSLLTSYLGIQYLIGQNAELGMQNLFTDKNYREMQRLEKQKDEKEKIITGSGLLSDKFLTQYAYEILRRIPSDIRLDELWVNPVPLEVETKKAVSPEYRTILIKGNMENEVVFNEWLQSLKASDWVKEMHIESMSAAKSPRTVFVIKLYVK